MINKLCLFISFFIFVSTEPNNKFEYVSNVKNPLVSSRIVNGTLAEIVNYPYQASLQYDNRHICGAAIINKKYLLTAAHCVRDYASKYSIKVGNTFQENGTKFKVDAVIPHPEYKNLDFDIAVIKINESLSFNERIQPIQLPKFNEYILPNTKAVVTGWGYNKEDGDVMDRLYQLHVPVLLLAKCRQIYEGLAKISQRMLCAGFLEGFKDACQGDSGGPLVSKGKLIGLVSFGNGCAKPGFPGIYTRVSRFIKWIKKVMKQQNKF